MLDLLFSSILNFISYLIECQTYWRYYSLNCFIPFAQEFLQLGAASICPEDPVLTVDDLADQIIEILNYFG